MTGDIKNRIDMDNTQQKKQELQKYKPGKVNLGPEEHRIQEEQDGEWEKWVEEMPVQAQRGDLYSLVLEENVLKAWLKRMPKR